MKPANESLVEFRCAVAVVRCDAVFEVADEFSASARLSGEPGRRPARVNWDDLKC